MWRHFFRSSESYQRQFLNTIRVQSRYLAFVQTLESLARAVLASAARRRKNLRGPTETVSTGTVRGYTSGQGETNLSDATQEKKLPADLHL